MGTIHDNLNFMDKSASFDYAITASRAGKIGFFAQPCDYSFETVANLGPAEVIKTSDDDPLLLMVA